MFVLYGFWTPCLVVHLIINNLGFLTTSHAQQVEEEEEKRSWAGISFQLDWREKAIAPFYDDLHLVLLL